MTTNETRSPLTRKDFVSDQDVRWCPGCGDYAILATMQKTLPELGATRENTVFVSGIGCSSRFPYYMSTYGFHTIHGRAPAIATGIKLTKPELDVWVITGDGDGLSIGGNHTMHMLRRNVDLNVLLFNNRIYGLTKGQYSPTSLVGLRTPSTPMGSVDAPLEPLVFALGCGARFVARSLDTMAAHLGPTFVRAHGHKGTSFVEILQNCPVFNDGTWDSIRPKDGHDGLLFVEHGKPLRYGGNRGLRVRPGGLELESVELGVDGITEADLLVHDETNRHLAIALAGLGGPNMPTAVGVLFCSPGPVYEDGVREQQRQAVSKSGLGDLQALLRSGQTWTVT